MDALKQKLKKALDEHYFNQLDLTETEAIHFANSIKQKAVKRSSVERLKFIVPTAAIILVLLISSVLLRSFVMDNNGVPESQTNPQVEIKVKGIEEQKRMLETYKFNDYKRVFDVAVSEANSFGKNQKLTKWIIRTLGNAKLYYETDLTKEQVLMLSNQAMEEDKVWKSIAKNEYGITVTDAEIDKYIKEGPDTSNLPQHLAYAASLGLTLKELNHNFDRDIYEKNLIWLKLKPELEKKYGINDNNKLVGMYEEEINERIKK